MWCVWVLASLSTSACASLSAYPQDRELARAYVQRYSSACAANETTTAGTARATRLETAALRSDITKHTPEVETCYFEALVAWPELSGQVDVRFTIDPQGVVQAAEPTANTTGVRAVGCCIAESMRRWKFTARAGDELATATYPFVLEQE